MAIAEQAPTSSTDPMLSVEKLCERWGVERRALTEQRYSGTGPKYFKVNRTTIRYMLSDVLAWEESQTRTSNRDKSGQ